MRTECFLYWGLHLVWAQWMILKPSDGLLLTVLRRRFWCNSYLIMLIGVGVSCRISYYSIVSYKPKAHM